MVRSGSRITEPQAGHLNPCQLLSHGCGGWKSKIKVEQSWGSGEGPLPGFADGSLLTVPSRGLSRVGAGGERGASSGGPRVLSDLCCTLVSLSNLHGVAKLPFSNAVVLGGGASTWEFVGKGPNSVQSIPALSDLSERIVLGILSKEF